MKYFFLLVTLFFLVNFGYSQTKLTAGDIAFMGSNSDGATFTDDEVVFVLLKDIDAATTIIFTDRGWNDSGGFFSTAGDADFTWLSGVARSAGDIVTINMGPLGMAGGAYSTIGDQLFAFQDSMGIPIFIAGLQYNDIIGGGNDANWDGSATTNSTSALPSALTTGNTAVRLSPEEDNWQFRCTLAGGSPIVGTPAAIRAILHNPANWVSNNSVAYTPALEAGCAVTISVVGDAIPPVVNCAPTPSPITAGINGMAAIPDLVTGSSATDNISLPANITITQSPTAGTMVGVGVTTVTVTAMDEASNMASCMINVTVNEPPFTPLTAGDIAFVGFNLDGTDGFAFVLLKDIIAGTNIKLTDCGVTNPNTISCNGSGESTSTWYAATAMSAGDIVSLDGSFFAQPLSTAGDQLFAYQGTAAAPIFLAGIHSNIETTPYATDDADWDSAQVNNDESALPDQLTNGVNAIRLHLAEGEINNWQFDCDLVPGGLTITGTANQLAAIINDLTYWASSNTTEFVPPAKPSCSYVITCPNPVAICQDIVLYLDSNGMANAIPSDIDNGSTADCGIDSMFLSQTTFTCTDTGGINVGLTVVDLSGNSTTCMATVTVLDTIAPTAVCQNITIYLDGTGNTSHTAIDIDGGSTDNCAIDTLTRNNFTHNCADLGNENSQLTVTDASGNVSTCVATITVLTSDTLTWTGTVNSDWSTNGNWLPCGIPNESTFCIIPDVTTASNNAPEVSGSGNQASSILMDTSASLTILSGGTLDVTGGLFNFQGIYLDTAAVLTVNDNGALNISKSLIGGIHLNEATFLNDGLVCIDSVDGDGILVDEFSIVTNNDSIKITNNQTLALNLSINTELTNNGVILIVNADSEGIDNNGHITNNGDLTIEKTNDGVALNNSSSSSVFDNYGTVTIDTVFFNEGITNDGFLTNYVGATLTVSSIIDGDEGIDNEGIIVNEGTLLLSNVTNSSTLYNDGSFVNSGVITLSAIEGAGIENDDVFRNLAGGSISIKISNAVGIENDDEFLNLGTICIQSDSVAGDVSGIGWYNTDGEFNNFNLLKIESAGGDGIYNEAGEMLNDRCGVIQIENNVLRNEEDIINNALIIAGAGTTVFNDGDIENNGEIFDPAGAFPGSGTGAFDENGTTGTSADTANFLIDEDGDGFFACEDCDDTDSLVNPAMTEVCNNGIDDNCNEQIDEDLGGFTAIGDSVLCPGDSVLLQVNVPAYVIDQTGTFAPLSTGAGTIVVLDDDEYIEDLPIGFDFEFFGNTYTEFDVSSNGYIGFDLNSSGCCVGEEIPDMSNPNNYIAVAWTDLDPEDGDQGDFEYYTTGTAPNRILVATFIDYATNEDNEIAQLTSQILLYEGSNIIEIHTTYQNIQGEDGIVMGIEDETGSNGFAVPGRNSTIWNTSNDYVAFIPDCTFNGWTNDQNAMVIDTTAIYVKPLVTTTYTGTTSCGVELCPVIVYVPNADTVTLASGSQDTTLGCELGSLMVASNNSDEGIYLGYDFILADLNGNIIDIQNATLPNPTATFDSVALDIVVGNYMIYGISYSLADPYDNTITDIGDLSDGGGCYDFGEDAGEFVSITAEDTIPPVAVCQNITVYLDATGNALHTAADIDGGSTDNCAIDLLTRNNFTHNCADLGNESSQLTVTDDAGNSSTCVATVTVVDTIAPSAVCAITDTTLILNAATNTASIDVLEVDGGSSDICGIETLTLDLSNFDCSHIGTNTISLNAVDFSGNVGTCAITVTITDTVAPTIVCSDTTIYLDENGNASISSYDLVEGLTSTSLPNSLAGILNSFTNNASNIASIIPQQYAIDFDQGLSGGANFIVDGGDDMYDDGNFLNTNLGTELLYTGGVIVPEGAFGAGGMYFTHVASNMFFMAADMNGVDSFFISGELGADSEGALSSGMEIIECDGKRYYGFIKGVDEDLGDGDPTVNHLIIVEDNSNATQFFNLDTDDDFHLVSNLSGSSRIYYLLYASLGTNAIITDEIALQMFGSVVQNILCSITIPDDCGTAMIDFEVLDYTCGDTGTTTMTVTAMDASGNISTCESMITVLDTIGPIITCPADTVLYMASASCGVNFSYETTDSAFLWANSVIGFSSQYTPLDWAATQALGEPDVYPLHGDIEEAWASISSGDQREYLEIGYEKSINVSQINIYETNRPGAIDTVYLRDANTLNWVEVWSGTAFDYGDSSRIFTIDVPLTSFNADAVRLAVNSPVVPSWNEIDAVQIVGIGTESAIVVDKCVDNPSATLTSGLESGSIFPIGVTTNTYSYTDLSGNSTSCSFTVTVLDSIAPIAVCNDTTIFLNGAGTASIIAADIDNGSTDNCVGVTLGASTTTFTCANVGPNTVTLTVTDGSLNTSTCAATVTVMDTIPPTAVCHDTTIFLDGAGNVSIVAADINNGSSDDCSAITLGASSTAFTCANVGPNSVTLTVTDGSLNTSTCTATVTVVDTIPPTVLCRDTIIYLNGSGTVDIILEDLVSSSNDACGSLPSNPFPINYSCADIGSNTETITVEDIHGNTSNCMASITVLDTIAPSAVCNNTTIFLNGAGTASIVAADINNGSADNCTAITLAASTTTFTCANVGPNTVTLTVTDGSLNTSTCTATVTVFDTIPTIAVCQDITVYLDATGNVSITAADIDAGSSDICDIESIMLDVSTFECEMIGNNTVTLTVTDNSENSATCSAIVEVLDTIAPTIICAANDTVNTNLNVCEAFVSVQQPIYLDNCGDALCPVDRTNNGSTIGGPTWDRLFQNGLQISTIGPVAYATFTFKVSADGLYDISSFQEYDGFLHLYENSFDPLDQFTNFLVANDDGLNGVGSSHIFGVNLTAGTTYILVTSGFANGDEGNFVNTISAQCNAIGARINFNQPYDNYQGISDIEEAKSAWRNDNKVKFEPITSRNASLRTMVSLVNDFNGTDDASGIYPLGTTVVTWTITDSSGNSATCEQVIVVEDNVDPILLCNDITIQLDASGNATIIEEDILEGLELVTINILTDSFPGETEWELRDGGGDILVSGGSYTGRISTLITEEIYVQCGLDYTFEIFDEEDDGICCGFGNGAYSVVVAGDTVAQGGEFEDSEFTTFSISDCAGMVFDNCGIDTLFASQTSFDCSNIGNNATIVTVKDENGNTTTCESIVTVEDTIPPTAVCQNITVYLDATGNALHTAADIDGGSTDNCAIDLLTRNNFTHNCADLGNESSQLTVTDDAGNSSTCVATVTVVDTIAPSAVCNDTTIFLNGAGTASIIAADIDNASTDNCVGVTLGASTTTFTCANVGPNTVTLTVTDGSLNTSTCAATVTVMDTIPPLALCNDTTIYLDASGNASITVNAIDDGSNDVCTDITYSIDINSFDCNNMGANNVTLTVTDVSGNASTCTAIVTIEDTIAPMAVCQNIIAYLDDNGEVSITAAAVDNGSSDACGLASLAIDATDFTCADKGDTTVTMTVTDNNGNMSTCTAIVTVVDTIAPAAVCNDLTVYLDASGNATIIESDINAGAGDNCDLILSIDIDTSMFTCNQIGEVTVTLTVEDIEDNIFTCQSTVTVEDTMAPVVVCLDDTVYLDASGMAGITASELDGGTTDNCDIDSISIDIMSFDCSVIGENNVTLTAVDSSGNTASCMATVTVLDTIQPTAVCQDIIVYLDASGAVSITAADVDGGSSDNCGLASISIDISDFSCADVGDNDVILTATGLSGNTDVCTAVVEVLDTVAPVVVCNDLTIYLDATGTVSITAADVQAGSTDACGIDTITIDITNFSCTDAGANTVTLTVEDENGNIAECMATVTVLDTISPTALCTDITVYLDNSGNVTIMADDVDGGSSDNCGTVDLSIDIDAFTCGATGANTVTLTVTDESSNSATCTAMVTVLDTIAPVASCNDITLYLDVNGNASIAPEDVIDNSNYLVIELLTDNFSEETSFEVEDGNGNIVLSVATGSLLNETNYRFESFLPCEDYTFTIFDEEEDGICCLFGQGSYSVMLGGNIIASGGSFAGSESIAFNVSSCIMEDNCTVDDISIDRTDFDCSNLGDNSVTVTFTDVSGNSSTCTSIVTVEDTIAPMFICVNDTVYLDENGEASVDENDLTEGISIITINILTDNYAEETTFELVDEGGNVLASDSYTESVDDNTLFTYEVEVVCDADYSFTIFDEEDDGICCSFGFGAYSILLDGDTMATGGTFGTSETIDITVAPCGVKDACGIDSVSAVVTDFSCDDIGDNPVVITVVDVNGNSDFCTATVTVLDTLAPIAMCQDFTVQLNASGDGTVSADDVDNGTTDNCALDSISLDADYTFNCSDVGTSTTVTLTAVDSSGNSASCTAAITVADTIPPVALCQAITIYLNDSGDASIVAADVDAGSNDACGIASLSIDIEEFNCSDIGANDVTLTATDVNGNSATCIAVVTVEDTIAPIVVCQDVIIYLDDAGIATVTASDVDNGSSDNCAIETISLDVTAFGCSDMGDNPVILTVTDSSGNSADCAATVTVLDTIPPTLACPGDTMVDGNTENCAAIVDFTVEAMDNCMEGLVVTYNYESGDTFPLGTTTVNYTATDSSGNSTSCSFDITVVSGLEIVVDTVIDASCFGGSDGEIQVTITGGAEPYEIRWSNNTHEEDPTDLTIGNYIMFVIDANGCTATSEPIEVGQPTQIIESAPAVIMDANCKDEASGSIDISISGGTPPYTYVWTNGSTDEDITELEDGIYQVIVTDANECEFLSPVYVVGEPTAVAIGVASITNVDCNGESTGEININVSGGVSPYTFVWSNGSTDEDLSNLAADDYSVVITDANGCTYDSEIYTITENEAIEITASTVENVECFGESSGSINISVAGGIPPYTYLWSNLETTQDVDGLGVGSYDVVITDALGCTFTSNTFDITEPTPLMAGTATVTEIICNGANTGSIEFNPSGGTPPYSFVWNDGSTDPVNDELEAGTYSATIFDVNGCFVVTDDVILGEPTAVEITSINVTSAGCNGEATGAIDIEVDGGTPPYSYDWSNGETTQDITDITSGSYTLEIMDANGCLLKSETIEVLQQSSMSEDVDRVITNVSCNGDSDGSIDVSITGGVPPYSFLWNNGEITEDISGLTAGSYSLVVTDGVGCTYETGLIEVGQPNLLTITDSEITDVLCFEASTGAVDITVEGGTTPYTYAWSNGSTTQDLTDVVSGSYNVVITDAKGCTFTSTTFLVNEIATSAIEITFDILPAQSNGSATGSITASATGGSGSYAFEWQDGFGNSPTLTNITNGIYCIEVLDTDGCLRVACGTVGVVTGIADVSLVDLINLYPNPASDYTTLEITLSRRADVRIEMLDVLGRQVKSFEQDNTSEIKAQFDIRTVADGTYFFQISLDGEELTLPFVIAR